MRGIMLAVVIMGGIAPELYAQGALAPPHEIWQWEQQTATERTDSNKSQDLGKTTLSGVANLL